MKILSLKPDHDGTVSFIEDEKLIFSVEAEKNNFLRMASLDSNAILSSLRLLESVPDVFALGGWIPVDNFNSGYTGLLDIKSVKQNYLGKTCHHFSSSHERSHIYCSYGLSPFPEGTECYALIWEGRIGSFYYINSKAEVSLVKQIMTMPGTKYVYPYLLCHPTSEEITGGIYAGTIMALAAYNKDIEPSNWELDILKKLCKLDNQSLLRTHEFTSLDFYRRGVDTDLCKRLSRLMSDMIFKEFYEYAEKNLTLGLPLLISGGCGLNCEWNTKWKKSGLFPEIFIPPCANDSGSSIGTAIDAQRFYTNKSKIKWSVYAGQEFIMDNTNLEDDFIVMDLNLEFLASLLHQGKIFAWVQGKYEMGPRALGNRSLLASPFNSLTKDRINKIKERERFRPVAPVCLEEDVGLHFEWSGPSPYMLFFQTVRNKQLEAITHVDGTARVQTVNKDQNFLLHELLAEFRKQSGVGVLCNTSLNYPRRGFINQMRDLVFYSKARGLDGFVVSQKMYLSTKNNSQI